MSAKAVRFAVIGSNFITDKTLEAGLLVDGFELTVRYSNQHPTVN